MSQEATSNQPDRSYNASKYLRAIVRNETGHIDVYAVLLAYDVRCPARQHAVKKLLTAGLRDRDTELEDLIAARDAVNRAIELAQAFGKK